MPIIKSAKKRVRVASKAAVRNSKTKRSLRTALRTFARKPAADALNQAQSELDKAVKKGVIHKNKAARMKKRAAAKAKAAGVKTATTKATKAKAKKTTTAATKAAAKKAPAKKPAKK